MGFSFHETFRTTECPRSHSTLSETARHPAEQAVLTKPTLGVAPPPWWLVASWAAVGLSALLRLAALKLGLRALCPLRTLTGIPCPTCGATHALMRLFERDVLAAAALNPLVTVGALTLLAVCVAGTALWLAGRPPRIHLGRKTLRLVRIAALIGLIANWLYLLIATQ